jgi:flagellar hook-associated protein 1
MSISQALRTAQGIFSNTGTQMSVASKNISNASNPDYQRRLALLSTTENGARVARIDRSQDYSLAQFFNESVANASGQSTLLDGLKKIQSVLGGNANENAPSTMLAALQKSLQTYATTPNNTNMAQSVVNAAGDVVKSLNTTSNAVQQLRADADKDIAQSVKDLNEYLKQFQQANDTVKNGAGSDKDINDALDQRDALIKKISEIVGVHPVVRANNDIALYTTDGTVLFETQPRTIAFTPNNSYTAGMTGGQITIDGVPLTPGKGGDTSAVGKLQALLQIRDVVAPQFQAQLDETARGLINAFAEKDRSGGGGVNKPGLFTWSGGTVPNSSAVVAGLASQIKVNPLVDPAQGGNIKLLRDGGINGAAYIGNTTGATGYSTIIQALVDNMDAPMAFNSAAGLDTNTSLLKYSTASIGWFQQLRKEATDGDERKQATLTRADEALANKVGVSIDEELALLMDLEQSYKASTKIVTTIDAMMQALLGMVK